MMRSLAVGVLTFFMAGSVALAGSVDLKKSTFQWAGTKKIGGGHNGKILLKSAKLIRDGDKLKSGTFVMDMSSISVDNLEGEWAGKFLGHVKSADFFDVQKFPTATLVIERSLDKDTIAGKLTIKGKTKAVKVDFKSNGLGRYTGQLKFDRTDFGIIYGSQNFFKKLVGDKIINNEVTIDFAVVAG